jgi:hypothetical protein
VKPWERWSFGVLSALVAVGGFAYLWMKYLLENTDPFAVVNHPWQPAILHLHVLASPPLVLVFGIILNSHIMKKLRATKIPNRKSGLLSLATFGAMIASGYLLQVVADERWLRSLVGIHVGSGTIFTVSYVAHLVISVRLGRRQALTSIREVA